MAASEHPPEPWPDQAGEARLANRSRQNALQQAELWVPLRDPGNDAAAAVALARAGQLSHDASAARQRNHHRTAERLTTKAELLTRQAEDTRRPPNLLIHEDENVYAELAAPDRQTLAAWLFGLPPSSPDHDIQEALDPDSLGQLDSIMVALTGHYRVGRQIADAIEEGHAHERLTRLAAVAEGRLRWALQTGLRQRVDLPLTHEELNLCDYLKARGITSRTHHICEACTTVFEGTRRAKRCPRCRHNRLRPTEKDWHVSVNFASRTAGARITIIVNLERTTLTANISRRRSGSSTYTAKCQECGAMFQSQDARTRFCPDHSTPAARTARSRRKQLLNTPIHPDRSLDHPSPN